jgi:guanosine-3',5'-bis(diphosphate) 3'-pyrophosphohydrolase
VDSARLFEALTLAAQAHRAQTRKGSGEPYVNHLIDVAAILTRVAQVTDADILIAALLHDVIEDTEVTAAELESKFGARVRALVEALTDDKSLPRLERKRLQIEHMRSAEHDAKLIKVADHCSNVATLPGIWTKERRVEYLDWSNEVVRACGATHPGLEREHRERVERARGELAAE